MRRSLKALGWALSVLLGTLALFLIAVLVAANTQPGRALIERSVLRLTGGDVRLEGLGAGFPGAVRLARIELRDQDGAWLVVDDFALHWEPSRLLFGQAMIDRLAASRIALQRLPAASSQPPAESGPLRLPVELTLRSLDVPRFEMGPAIAGAPAAFAIQGQLGSLEQGRLVLDVRGFDGAGRYQLAGSIEAQALQGRLKVEEPPDGLLARLAGLRDVGVIDLEVSFEGPRSALATELSLSAGPLNAQAHGTLDLPGRAVDLQVAAAAPAMSPRADIAWQSVSLDASLHGPLEQVEGEGELRVAGLSAGGAEVRSLAADIRSDAGKVRLRASLETLRIPGPRPDLLAAAPLVLEADARLDQPDRPVTFTLTHPLVGADGELRTAGPTQATIDLRLPDLAPLAAVGDVDVRGQAQWRLTALGNAETTTLEAQGTVGITGGAPPLPGLLGDAARIAATAVLRGEEVRSSRLEIDGKTVRLTATGSLISQVADLEWQLSLADLAIVAPNLSGALQAKGRIAGPTHDLTAMADLSGKLATAGLAPTPIAAHFKVKGLPTAPTGQLTAEGTLDGSPLALALIASRSDRGETQIEIQRADWKSAHGEGQMALAPGALFPVGTLTLRMSRLEDLQRLVGRPVTGRFSANLTTTAQGSATRLRVSLDAHAAGLSGAGTVDQLTLVGTVLDPATRPVVDASLAIEGLRASGVEASGRLELKGPQDALKVQLVGDAQELAGAPAQLSAAAVLDAPGKRVAVSSLQASWKGETARLLAPVRVTFAKGVGVDRLRIGLQQAVLEVAGQLSPTLSLTAQARELTPDLADAFVPGLQAEGKIEADARLKGTLDRPEGTVRLAATGLRMRSGAASALPAVDLTVAADLAGQAARIDGRLTAGPKARLSLTGEAPLTAEGRLALLSNGNFDLTLLDPILTAVGRRVRGQVQLDVRMAGTAAKPRLDGSVQVVKGEVQDFTLGAYLKDIDALLELDGDHLRIARLSAGAGPGILSASGDIGILAPDLPVELKLTARKARPLASDLLTVDLSGDLSARGQLAKQLLLAGKIDIEQAEIQLPETLPTSVATLNVRRPGEAPPPPSAPGPVVDLDLTVKASRQIFVRGRGLDAELGGRVRVRGTLDDPQPLGRFELRRGQFSLAGRDLTISSGEVGFNGGSLTDPSINFTVSSTGENVTAELTIGGTVSNPKITLSSTPTLPQDEVLAELLFDRSAATLSPFELAQIALALAKLTGVTPGGGDPLSGVRQAFGLSQLSVGTSAAGGATIEAGRYVEPGVYVGVEQGATAGTTEAKVRVDLTRRLKLEGTVGTNPGSATGSSGEAGSRVGVTYQFEY